MTQTDQNPLVPFVRRYRGHTALLVEEMSGRKPDAWQRKVFDAFDRGERLISMCTCHGVGKTFVEAWCSVAQILTKYPQKTVCTAPTAPQLFDNLVKETKSAIKQLPIQIQETLDVKNDRIELRADPDGSFISWRTSRPETPEALQGIHSDHVLIIVDEASGVHEKVYEAAVGSMAGHNSQTLLGSNPVRTSGLFFDTWHKLKDMWFTIRVSASESPRVSKEFINDVARRYGEDSDAYRVRVLGLFPKSDTNVIVPYELVMGARERQVEPVPNAPEVWGLDVARSLNRDESALARRKGNVMRREIQRWRFDDTMQLVGVVKAEWDALAPADRPVEILVDVIGWGAGVCDRLRELKLPARGINVSESPTLDDKQYHRLRDELWFKGRDWFASRDCRILDDEKETLTTQLSTPTFKILSSGRKLAESKDSMLKRGFKSPNGADAFLLTFASTAATAAGAANYGGEWDKPLSRKIEGIV